MDSPDIDHLIAEAERWRREHKIAGRHIEAAACRIRIQALKDAKKSLQPEEETRA
jgi:hypothetical protein